jgi:hypothetical protein
MTASTSPWKRYVVGPDEQSRSAVLADEATIVQSRGGYYWWATLWLS